MSQIFDPIRKKYVECTPEEEVRQGIISSLMEVMEVPPTHIAVEQGFKFNGLQYRADVIVYRRDLTPALLVECKAPSVRLTDKVIDQVVRYNMVLGVDYIMITNGRKTCLAKLDHSSGSFEFVTAIPKYSEIAA
ncbi:MAG: type I restriction enzyme HsdR N-terminal domain-containing protein [Bacteroidales bacterium]|nr:type I restriction enzyme HsdR N-terminal domain-containing protein [Bacteroidales bacterium]MBO7487673.1 type I restriction enzyme HsdR N-terminal domain-containing protein [Bacteroidales bacterium]